MALASPQTVNSFAAGKKPWLLCAWLAWLQRFEIGSYNRPHIGADAR